MKYYINTLGCKVNTYESNFIEEQLIKNGYIKGTMEDCDLYIVNSCSVTNQADNKSMKAIRHGIDKEISVVCGCFSQRNADRIKDLNISIIIGNKYKSDIINLFEEFSKMQLFLFKGLLSIKRDKNLFSL